MIIINTFYILLDRFNLTFMEIMSDEGYDYNRLKNHRKIMFKDFTNTDTKFLGYLAKLFSFLSLWMTGYSCFE